MNHNGLVVLLSPDAVPGRLLERYAKWPRAAVADVAGQLSRERVNVLVLLAAPEEPEAVEAAVQQIRQAINITVEQRQRRPRFVVHGCAPVSEEVALTWKVAGADEVLGPSDDALGREASPWRDGNGHESRSRGQRHPSGASLPRGPGVSDTYDRPGASSAAHATLPAVLLELEALIEDSQRSCEESLQTVLDRLVRGLGMEYGLVADFTEDALHLAVRAAVGWPKKLAQGGRLDLEEGSQAAYILGCDEAVAIPSLFEETRFEPDEWLTDWGVESALGVAVRFDGEPVGLLLCATTEARELDAEAAEFAERLAPLLARCLQRVDHEHTNAVRRRSRTAWLRKPATAPAQTVLDALEHGVLVTDPAGRVTDCNRAVEHLLSRERTSIVGTAVAELLPLDGTAQLEPVELDDSGKRYEQAETLVRLEVPGEQSRVRWLTVSQQPFADGFEPAEESSTTVQLGRVYCVADVTARKQAEIELRRTRFRLEGAREIALELLDERELPELIGHALERLRTRFPRRRVAYATLDADGRLRLEQAAGAANLAPMRGATVALGAATELVGALQANATVVVFEVAEDVRTAPAFEALERTGAQAAVFVPVRLEADGRVRLLLLEADHPVRWRPLEVDLLEDAAEFLALALHRSDEVHTHTRARQALARTEERHRALAELVPDCVYGFVRSASGTFDGVWASEALHAISGLSPQELPPRDPLELLVHPEDRERLDEAHDAGGRTTRELRILTKERRIRWVRDTRRTVPVDGGGERVEGVLRDITETRRESQLRTRTHRLLKGIVEGKPLSETLQGLVRLLEEQSERSIAAISLVEEDKRHLRLVAGPGLPRPLKRMLEWVRVAPDTTLCGSAAHRRSPVWTRDLASDPRYVDLDVAEHEVHGAWALPVLGADQTPLATISLYLHEVRTVTDFERELLEAAAKVAKLAIQNWRTRVGLYHRLQIERTKGRLAQGLATDGVPDTERMLAMLGNLVSADVGYWTVLQEGEPVEHVDWARDSSTGVPMRALARHLLRAWHDLLAEGKPVHVEDTGAISHEVARDALAGYRFGSLLLLPVRDEARQLRAVVGFAREALWTWPEQDVRALRSMCDLLGRVLGRREQRQLEHEQGQLALAVVHSLPEALVLVDGDGRILWYSTGWPRMFGFTGEVILGSTLTDWVHPEEVTHMQMGVQRLFDGDAQFEAWTLRLMRDTNDWLLVEAVATLMPSLSGGTPQLLLALRTLPVERQRLEENARIQHQTGLKVARQLHEGLGRELTEHALELGRILHDVRPLDETLAERVEFVGAALDQLLTEVRQMARAVHPSQLEPDELPEALANLAAGFEDVFGVRCQTRFHPEATVPDASAATQLYAIAQEAVHNALRHAAPETVELELDLNSAKEVVLRVSDNGDGIEEIDPEEVRGLGLRIMHARARLIGAELSIRRGSPRGSVVQCRCGRGKSLSTTGDQEAE